MPSRLRPSSGCTTTTRSARSAIWHPMRFARRVSSSIPGCTPRAESPAGDRLHGRNPSETPSSARTEIDRYIVYPGQACSYKVGQTAISRLRDEVSSHRDYDISVSTTSCSAPDASRLRCSNAVCATPFRPGAASSAVRAAICSGQSREFDDADQGTPASIDDGKPVRELGPNEAISIIAIPATSSG